MELWQFLSLELSIADLATPICAKGFASGWCATSLHTVIAWELRMLDYIESSLILIMQSKSQHQNYTIGVRIFDSAIAIGVLIT